MNVDKIKMPIELAKQEWKKYNDLLKTRKEKYLEDMKKAMHQLKQGNELIDIYVVMEKTGVNKLQQPKLAIARADWKNVFFIKKDDGRGFYAGIKKSWQLASDGDIDMKPKTFMHWARIQDNIKMSDNTTRKVDRRWEIANETLKTKVPIIPSNLYPEGDLAGYYILWEVEQWQDVPPPKDDPILLKRITTNLFVILGYWDVTDLEQSIINGL